jgi:hypothetical protein
MPSVQLIIHCYTDGAVPPPTVGSTYTKHCTISVQQDSKRFLKKTCFAGISETSRSVRTVHWELEICPSLSAACVRNISRSDKRRTSYAQVAALSPDWEYFRKQISRPTLCYRYSILQCLRRITEAPDYEAGVVTKLLTATEILFCAERPQTEVHKLFQFPRELLIRQIFA